MASCSQGENRYTLIKNLYACSSLKKLRFFFFQNHHENKRIILSFPQSVLLLWSKLVQLYFGNTIVFEIVLREGTDRYFLFCTRDRSFLPSTFQPRAALGKFKTEALTPNTPTRSPRVAAHPARHKGQELCPSPGVQQRTTGWVRTWWLPLSTPSPPQDRAVRCPQPNAGTAT